MRATGGAIVGLAERRSGRWRSPATFTVAVLIASWVLTRDVAGSLCATQALADHSPTSTSDGNAWREPARDALRSPCGSCHLPGLPTSQDKALAVFDLSQTDWAQRLTRRRLASLQRRVGNTKSLDEAGRNAVLAFVARELERLPEETQ